MALLEVRDLRLVLGGAAIVDGVDLSLDRGRVLGLAGESGSGKTMTAYSILGLQPAGAERTGAIDFAGQDLLRLSPRALLRVRGVKIGMIFQDPASSLHPMLTVGRQLTEHVRYHLRLSGRAARERASDLLEQVRIPDPRGALDAYPMQFSGGMRQRIQIAAALACEPELLIADEPTTALDVTVQAGILRLLDDLRRERGLAVLMITHDLGVLSALADEMAVMYAGRIVEGGPARTVITAPRHPYTRGLLDSLPHPERGEDEPLRPIPGSPPSPSHRPLGCPFHPRCPYALDSCRTEVPALVEVGDGHRLACPVDPLLGVGMAS